jgi:hypothetical protein
MYRYVYPAVKEFRDRAISLDSSKILDKKEIYLLFLMAVYIVQLSKLVQFT